MSDIPDHVLAMAAMVTDSRDNRIVLAAAKGIMAERERIACWHEAQADALDKAIDKILSEGGTIDVSSRSLSDLHRGFAASIRKGTA